MNNSNNPIIRRKRHRKDARIRLREGARTRAIKKGWGFNINKFKDLPPVPKKCPILDIPLEIGDGHSTDNSPTLDRVRNEEFYYSERYGQHYRTNVQIISRKANQMKSNATFEDVEKLYFNMLLKESLCSKNWRFKGGLSLSYLNVAFGIMVNGFKRFIKKDSEEIK